MDFSPKFISKELLRCHYSSIILTLIKDQTRVYQKKKKRIKHVRQIKVVLRG